MEIGRLLAPIHSLGPGERIGLWTLGCDKNCKGCISPEFKNPDEKKDIPIQLLVSIIRQTAKINECTGITISGGDPFCQPEELCKLLREIRGDFKDILVYTGYLYEDIAGGKYGDAARDALTCIDVLIDGPYIEEENFCDVILRGSKNQKILIFNPELEEIYKEYMKEGRLLENFTGNGHLYTVGIQNGGQDE